MRAIEAGVFRPVMGWQCKDCSFQSKCWAWGGGPAPAQSGP
jgi:CRISPR/Cas system-associated exonuclease Cas4 (RecB family)